MNRITVLGNLCADAEKFDVETRNGNSSYVSFFIADYGTPTKKGDPLTLEVHFSKDVALKLLPDLKKGKEVLVDGFLVEKSYVTRAGVPKTKIYASANTVLFTGKNDCEKRETEVAWKY